jgi:outer membrane immunogenic protein
MRRLLAVLAMTGLVSDALAGEFEMPTLRGASTDYAPTPFVAAPPIFTRWSGFYAGGQGSGSIAGMDFSTSVRSLLSFATRNSELERANVTDWTTLRNGDTSGAGFGGFVGYNTQWDDVTLGVEANYTHSSLSKSASNQIAREFKDSTTAPAGTEYKFHAKIDANAAVTLTDFGSLRARGGWAAGNVMPYAFAGLAVARANAERSVTVTETRTDTVTTTTTDLAGRTTTTTTVLVPDKNIFFPPQKDGQTAYSFGYTLGAGMDVLVTGNLFVRGEYEYVRFPDVKGTRINLNTVRLGGGLKF